MKIIHLSDLHLGYAPRGGASSKERFRTVVDHLRCLKRPCEKYVVVITGDIADDGSKAKQHIEAKAEIDRLARDFAVCVVPGNHDYGWGGMLATEPNKKSFKATFYGDEDEAFPRLQFFGGHGDRTAFIGLDSMEKETEGLEGLFANGELGTRQLQGLKDMLASGEVAECKSVVAYLHHHPFHPRAGHELKDSESLMSVLEGSGKVSALLFGHNHMGFNFNGCRGIRRCYDGGSSTRKEGSASATRVIDLDKEPRTDYAMEIITQYDLERGRPRRGGR